MIFIMGKNNSIKTSRRLKQERCFFKLHDQKSSHEIEQASMLAQSRDSGPSLLRCSQLRWPLWVAFFLGL